MKNIISILCLCLALPALAQQKGDIKLQLAKGNVVDVYNNEGNINPHSPDMQSELNGRDDLKQATSMSASYYLTEKLAVGLSYTDGSIAGSNEVEYYQNTFTDKSLSLQYDLFDWNKFNSTALLSYGEIDYSGARYFVRDEMKLFDYSSTAKKKGFGLQLNYQFNDQIQLFIQWKKNLVEADEFDGWDYGSETDEYIIKAIGFSFSL